MTLLAFMREDTHVAAQLQTGLWCIAVWMAMQAKKDLSQDS